MEAIDRLQIACLRYVLGDLTSDGMVRVADEALAAGLYSPALDELAALRRATLVEVAPLLERVAQELNFQLPSRDETLLLIRFGLIRVAAGEMAPSEGLRLLIPLVLDVPDLYEGDANELLQFVGWDDEYCRLRPSPGAAVDSESDELDEQVRQAAQEWLRQHGA